MHGSTRVRIERRERFIHQQHLRLVGEHTRDLDPLLHAAREFGRVLVFLAFEADQLEVALRRH